MSIKDSLLPEFDQEMSNTRRVLERVPADKLDWRPHPKSGTFAWLAGHVANMAQWSSMIFATESFDIAPKDGEPPPRTPVPESTEQLLQMFEENMKKGREAIASASDEELMKTWALLNGGQTIFAMPKVAVLRSMVMNHLIHHRAELCVYLRLNGVPVPGLYGPSADENM